MWTKCVITVKGLCNAAPWSQTEHPPLQWKLWTSLGFSHMDMILQADAKVDLKERTQTGLSVSALKLRSTKWLHLSGGGSFME